MYEIAYRLTRMTTHILIVWLQDVYVKSRATLRLIRGGGRALVNMLEMLERKFQSFLVVSSENELFTIILLKETSRCKCTNIQK